MTAWWEGEMRHLLRWVQDGVVSRRQLLDLGAAHHDVQRLVRRRDLTPVHPGVYVDHTGPLTWDQRAWAAVLAHHPAALTMRSALPGSRPRAAIQVAIATNRTVKPLPGVVAVRTARWESRLQPGSAPPRLAPAEAAVEVAAIATAPSEAYAFLAGLCQDRVTDVDALRAALARRRGLPHGQLLGEMLDDLAAGACSVLEREYLVRVERGHGLPAGLRQRAEATRSGRVVRDVDYEPWGVLVELDGRAFHDRPAQRDRDLGRDLDAVVAGDRVTVRLGWGQVLRDSCRTAASVGRLLQRRGWPGTVTPCRDCLDL